MRYMLSNENLKKLRRFSQSNSLIAFDYDGTLAPIVPDPDRAVMRTTTRELLSEVAKAYPCLVLSGRTQADILRRLRGIGMREVVGNHGIEPWSTADSLMDEVERWGPILEKRLSGLRGVMVENKIFSVAIHYRRCLDKKRALTEIRQAARALGRLRIVGGKQVINLLPEHAPDKGIALERSCARLGCAGAVYVGDDETDEDVFALGSSRSVLTIRVGHKRKSSASFYIRRQLEIDDLLRSLLRFRKKASARRHRQQ